MPKKNKPVVCKVGAKKGTVTLNFSRPTEIRKIMVWVPGEKPKAARVASITVVY